MDSDDEDDGFFVDHGYLSSDEGSQGGDDLDENEGAEIDCESKKPKILTEKKEENEEKTMKHLNRSSNEEEHEQRRRRLEQKAEEYKAEIRRKERLFKVF
jgi:hypothetical protein